MSNPEVVPMSAADRIVTPPPGYYFENQTLVKNPPPNVQFEKPRIRLHDDAPNFKHLLNHYRERGYIVDVVHVKTHDEIIEHW